MNPIPEPISITAPANKAGAVLFSSPAASQIPAEQGCRNRSRPGFIGAIRAIIRGLVDDSAFQDASLGREISVIFTSNGPLIYRHQANNAADLGSASFPNEKQQKPCTSGVPNRLGRSS
jgi:hypothetical protein